VGSVLSCRKVVSSSVRIWVGTLGKTDRQSRTIEHFQEKSHHYIIVYKTVSCLLPELGTSVGVSSVPGVSNIPVVASQDCWLSYYPAVAGVTCSRLVILLLLSPCSCCSYKKTFVTIGLRLSDR
jgi:hypothetical protein